MNRIHKKAILKPLEEQGYPFHFEPESVDTIVEIAGGYPYFIQFIYREVYNISIQQSSKRELQAVSIASIYAKLDSDFLQGDEHVQQIDSAN